MSEFVEELHQDPEDVEEELAKKEFGLLMYRLQKLSPRARARLQSDFAQRMVETTLPIETPKGKLSFVLLGKTSAGRAMSLLTKQPATIEWIDGFQPGSVFWDVGASIGVFSLYAALGTDTKVIAFEPAAVNYYLLSANCEANSLLDQIDCLLVGLGSEPAIARLEVSQFRPGISIQGGVGELQSPCELRACERQLIRFILYGFGNHDGVVNNCDGFPRSFPQNATTTLYELPRVLR